MKFIRHIISLGPPPPSDVSVSQNGLNSLLVTWTPSGSVTGYTVHYQQIDGTQNGSVIATDTSVIITGLMVGATFSISVSANSNTLSSAVIHGPDVIIHYEEGLCEIEYNRRNMGTNTPFAGR